MVTLREPGEGDMRITYIISAKIVPTGNYFKLKSQNVNGEDCCIYHLPVLGILALASFVGCTVCRDHASERASGGGRGHLAGREL